ncbi:hypothetical protein BKA63DRAFT_66941 [Paraphoma chrysanthemicola]|nr:hypothetical protein BKA63DRAFT_66941 [Paraphoma chrysanthemicola]
MAPRFRAEHVGSLIRPATILDAQSFTGQGPKERSATLDAAVHDVIRTQLTLGITPITNGEYPRRNFFSVIFDKLDGFEFQDAPIPDGFRAEIPIIRGAAATGMMSSMLSPVAVAPIRWVQSAIGDEWAQIRETLEDAAGGDEVELQTLLGGAKITMPSPIVHHIRLKRGTAWTAGSGYKSDTAFFADLTAAYRQEIKSLYNAGCRYIQIDDPDLLYFCDESFLDALEQDGVSPDALLSTYLQAHNDCLENRPNDLTMAIHLCRGNLTDERFLTKGSYEKIAPRLFNELRYDSFLLEYDTDKAGSFEPLRHLPVGKTIALGIVSTKDPELEDLDTLEGKVKAAAAVIAEAQNLTIEEVLENQLAVCPQCGFASAEFKKAVGSEERMWKKLCLLRDLTQRMWPVS